MKKVILGLALSVLTSVSFALDFDYAPYVAMERTYVDASDAYTNAALIGTGFNFKYFSGDISYSVADRNDFDFDSKLGSIELDLSADVTKNISVYSETYLDDEIKHTETMVGVKYSFK